MGSSIDIIPLSQSHLWKELFSHLWLRSRAVFSTLKIQKSSWESAPTDSTIESGVKKWCGFHGLNHYIKKCSWVIRPSREKARFLSHSPGRPLLDPHSTG